jgi:hypothetical protein
MKIPMRHFVLISILASVTTAVALAQTSATTNPSPGASNHEFAPPPATWDDRVTNAFFPDVRTVLVGPRPASLTAAMTGAGQFAKNSQAAAAKFAGDSSTGASSAYVWSKLISADTLQDEIKSLQPILADDVKTQQGFLGGAYKKSRRTLSLLAVAFAIISQYDADVKWKDQAPAARDLFARSGFNCKASTDQTYRDVKQRSEDLATLLRGENIEAPKVETAGDWSKIADLLPLMARFELAQRDRIAPWTASDAAFKKNASALHHESEIIAALSEVISRPGMENAEDEKFRGYAKALQISALQLNQAVADQNYDAARTAAGTLTKACANCHADFR